MPQSQQNSAQMLTVAEPPSQILIIPEQSSQVSSVVAEADNVLTNIPPPVSKPTERLVPLDLQPFVR